MKTEKDISQALDYFILELKHLEQDNPRKNDTNFLSEKSFFEDTIRALKWVLNLDLSEVKKWNLI